MSAKNQSESKFQKDVPLEHQVAIFGLEPENVVKLRGKHVLDLACGLGNLVEYLRVNGVNAEGIDPRAPERDYFTKRLVMGMGENRGLPATENSYDAIFSFQNPILNSGVGDGAKAFLMKMGFAEGAVPERIFFPPYEAIRTLSRITIYEIGRTLKQEGKSVIYPALTGLDKETNNFLRQNDLAITQERIENVNATVDYLMWECDCFRETAEKVVESHGYRTVLTRL